MALSRGMTALRAALGAVGGGLEGYAQMRALEQKRQQEQEAMRRQSMMDTLSLVQAGAMPTAQRRAVAQEGTSAIGSAITSAMNVAGGGPAIPFDAGAIQRGAGRLGAPAAQITLGETSYDIPSFEEQAQARQARELAQYEAQQGVIEKRESAKEERANRGYFDVLQKAGEIPPNATFDAYRNAPLKPTFDEYLKRTALQEALKRTNIMAGAQASRGGYIQGVDPGTGQPQYYFAPSGGGVPQPTGVQAPGKESPLSERAKKIQETTRPLSTDDAAFVRSFMPTQKMDAQGNVVGYDPPQRRLPASQALVSRGADIVGGLTGEAMYMGASPEAQRLSNIINQQADRRALAEQGGRLSDRDVAIKRAEVAIRSGDVKNDPVLYRKLNDVLSWAQTEPAPQAAQPSAPPTPRPTAQSQGISKAQFANQWKAANPKGANESLEAYARRIQSAWMASQGGR